MTTDHHQDRLLVPDCDEVHHARGFCVLHYQQWRRSPTGEPPLAEVKAERDREWRDQARARARLLGEGRVRPFADEAEQRRAWEEFGPEITAEFEAHGDGHRPMPGGVTWPSRPEYLGRCPGERGPHGLVKRIRWSHEAKVESL